ncbi:MAG TPA: DUF934 domain-containing protein [Caulobacteraceae bacterium]|jgi:uncharacterized protein (DUF934 family)|nr:DUF934 domain-containing protein [Caulobacteraceae bacterium]
MPKLIRWTPRGASWAPDTFTSVSDEETIPEGDILVSLTRFHAEGGHLLGDGRRVGVRVAADEAVESLAFDLPAIALVALEFPKFKDGRAYSAARILRERFAFVGEVRAVGDVLLEQARFMIRCGFDAFEPADGTSPEQWTAAEARYRHVYQRAADGREPAFAERAAAVTPVPRLWDRAA